MHASIHKSSHALLALNSISHIFDCIYQPVVVRTYTGGGPQPAIVFSTGVTMDPSLLLQSVSYQAFALLFIFGLDMMLIILALLAFGECTCDCVSVCARRCACRYACVYVGMHVRM